MNTATLKGPSAQSAEDWLSGRSMCPQVTAAPRECDEFDFRDLFVLDLANNHGGSQQLGLEIIQRVGEVVAGQGVRAALKFQFRELDSLIHSAHKSASTHKHIPRFLQNAFTAEQFRQLASKVRESAMITMATPFDEPSVHLIEELDIEVIKIASCSATDWPLLETVAEFNKPVIVSTGGLTHSDIDNVVSFLEHRRVHFALMHCVAIYPTPTDDLQLNQIQEIKARHPKRIVGFSTHEDPRDTDPVIAAVAKGAEMLERHVGVETDEVKLNRYSSSPELLDQWISAAKKARKMSGAPARPAATSAESAALMSLKRGVFAARNLKVGERLNRSDVYFALPLEPGQLVSGHWKSDSVVTKDVKKDEPLSHEGLSQPEPSDNVVLIQAIHEIKSILNQAKIALPVDFSLEFSHHYGKQQFREVGATLIDCVNRSYCKKLIVQLPGQRHPSHYHKKKEETFQVLSGELDTVIDSRVQRLVPGDMAVVPVGVWHSFSTSTGVVFEEISSTHYRDDSFYQDKEINKNGREQRKTKVSQWGRYQLS